MPFRLTADESVRAGLLRVVREEADSAVTRLRDADRAGRDEAIHEARKSIKKIRAAVRLAGPWLGDQARRGNLLLRDAGRALSAYRDAAVLPETIDELAERYGVKAPAKTLKKLRGDSRRDVTEQEESEQRAVLQKTVDELRQFERELAGWPDLPNDFAGIGDGLRETYRRGRRALRRCKAEPSAENFHELRKRAKDHWYQVQLVQDVWPGPMKARAKCLKSLQEDLGDDHNLALLAEKSEAGALADVIKDRQRELRVGAMTLARKVYAERPRDYERRVRDLWHVWRD